MLYIFLWLSLLVTNPYLMGTLFAQALIIQVCLTRRVRKFVSFILFIVYIGGLFILFSYCIMLLPNMRWHTTSVIFFGVPILFIYPFPHLYPLPTINYGLLFRASAVFLIALLLYLAILAIVTIVDYSKGMLKTYDTYAIATTHLLLDDLFINETCYTIL